MLGKVTRTGNFPRTTKDGFFLLLGERMYKHPNKVEIKFVGTLFSYFYDL